MTTPSTTQLVADETGYADVNGLHLYWERYGDSTDHPPIVLLHGGMLTIELSFAALIPTLARTHTVIGVEQQGHGRTANTDRPVTYPNLASDVVALLDELGIEKATVIGHSMGGGAVLELMVSHGGRLAAAVPMSTSISLDGMHPDLQDPSTFETSPIMPTAQDFADFKGAYERLSPHPEKFDEFLASMSAMDADFAGWSDDQLAAVSCPVLLVQGDRDFTLNSHAAVMQEKIPGSALAILPDTTHMEVTRRADLLLPILARFVARYGL